MTTAVHKTSTLAIASAIAAAILLFFLGTLGAAKASTVRQVDFVELVAGSELIFRGRVTGIQSQHTADKQAINTEIEFEILETIVGEIGGNRLTLSFPAGQAGDIRIVVHGLQLPRSGEEGVYFVESTSQKMVNPFYGWTQGQFLVARDPADQTARILTADGSPVLKIHSAQAPVEMNISRGTALGVESSPDSPVSAAISLDDFRQAILATAGDAR